MALWEDFNAIFSFNKKFAYDTKTFDTIIANRRSLENRLFADRLLGLLGIKGGMNRSLKTPIEPQLLTVHVISSHQGIPSKDQCRPEVPCGPHRFLRTRNPPQTSLDLLHPQGLSQSPGRCVSLCANMPATREISPFYRGLVAHGPS